MCAAAVDLIGKLMEEFRTVTKTETILGEKVQVGDITLIPVSKITLGIGAGAGQGSENKKAGEGGGGGGGVSITPIAFIVIKGGEISFHGIKRGGTLEVFLEKLPEMATKIMAQQQEAELKEETA